jgi:hypothetical protein
MARGVFGQLIYMAPGRLYRGGEAVELAEVSLHPSAAETHMPPLMPSPLI